MRHVPDWFPGTTWKQLGREWGENGRALVNTPFELVQGRRVRGRYPGLHCPFVRIRLIQAVGVSVPSFTDENITEGMTEQEEDLVKWAANAIIMGTKFRVSGFRL